MRTVVSGEALVSEVRGQLYGLADFVSVARRIRTIVVKS
jgi:hypothetical protein